MKHLLILITFFVVVGFSYAQTQVSVNLSPCETAAAFDKSITPDLGIIIYSDDAETAWNAIRLANYSQDKGDKVFIFVLGKGLDVFIKEQADDDMFHIHKISDTFLANGGTIYSCASCAVIRGTEEIQSCTITSIADLYEIVTRSKRLLTF
ncbi:MAG: DsrE family protein [Bacteroidales bacterium]|jgi:uncharacterized protein involved in oxidation of intracellular sulfur|nr:DsrE family protein [Bacteroidales bacterium]